MCVDNIVLTLNLRYLEGGSSVDLMSLDGPVLDKELKNYEGILRNNRRNLLNAHFIDGKKRADAEVQMLYVTAEERAMAEDIKNATKDDILRRIAEKLQQVSDEEIRGPLSKKLDILKAQPSKAKKETMLMLYDEIIEELQHQEAQEPTCVVEEEGQDD